MSHALLLEVLRKVFSDFVNPEKIVHICLLSDIFVFLFSFCATPFECIELVMILNRPKGAALAPSKPSSPASICRTNLLSPWCGHCKGLAVLLN